MTKISLFDNIKQIKNGKEITFEFFLDGIRDGMWEDDVYPVRNQKDKKLRSELKKDVPNVTISGVFGERKDSDIKKSSGLIAIDIDDQDPEEVKKKIENDQYVRAAFTSISGNGVCIVFKIDARSHRNAFYSISEYLLKNYKLITDPTSVNKSRARFISFDPYLLDQPFCNKFDQIVRPKKEKKLPPIVFVEDDFERIVKQIEERRIDLTETYDRWLRVGFALSDHFGESGRSYYHRISYYYDQYEHKLCDRQYDNCMKARGTGVTIATIYYYAKEHGVTIQSAQTKTIALAAQQGKRGKRDKESVIKLLFDVEQIPENVSAPIVDQVYDKDIAKAVDDIQPIEELEVWLRQNYAFKRNEVTRRIEIDGVKMEEKDFNTIYIQAMKSVSKVSYNDMHRLVTSDFSASYNPIREWFEDNSHLNPKGKIEELLSTIKTDTGTDVDYLNYFGKKWIVSIVASAFGVHSALMLILSGSIHGTGKTKWFRGLLPNELKPYYAESKLDRGKDDEILMCEKLIIMDDEMDGRSKKDYTKMKSLLSKQTFNLREPYGRYNIDRKRLSVLCGTSNKSELLNDPTGNRRIIPVNVLDLDMDSFYAIDKTEVFIEAYNLLHQGFEWILTREDIEILNNATGNFEEVTAEAEAFLKYYDKPLDGIKGEWITLSDIENKLNEDRKRPLNRHTLRQEVLRILGKEPERKRIGGRLGRYYEVRSRLVPVMETEATKDIHDKPPF